MICASSEENLSSGFPTRSDINFTVKPRLEISDIEKQRHSLRGFVVQLICNFVRFFIAYIQKYVSS